MGIIEIILISLGVSVDAAAVSVSGALCPGKYSRRRCAFNAALFFGGFQFFMPLAGFYIAAKLSVWLDIRQIDHYLAFLLLLIVGVKMIREGVESGTGKNSCPLGEFFSFGNLFLPAVATSLDALAIGGSIAFTQVDIWLPASAMGITTAVISGVCVVFGKFLAKRLNCSGKLTVIAGAVIIMIGVKILITGLLNG